MVEGHTHPEPPLQHIFLEEAKTDCAGPATAVCPYVEAGVERRGDLPQAGGYLSPREGGSGRPKEEAAGGLLLHSEQGRVSGLDFLFTVAYFCIYLLLLFIENNLTQDKSMLPHIRTVVLEYKHKA